jgi:hypothetical protein
MTRHKQLQLFDAPTFNVVKPQKEAMRTAVKGCGLSREQIVDQMNDLAGRYGVSLASNGGLTLDTFEKWINPGELNRQMPMKALPIFCAIINDHSAMDVMARPLGVEVIGPVDQNLLKWARAYFKARDARKAMRQLENDL